MATAHSTRLAPPSQANTRRSSSSTSESWGKHRNSHARPTTNAASATRPIELASSFGSALSEATV